MTPTARFAAAYGPGNAVPAHDSGDLLANMALQHRPPRHQRELAGFLDDGKAAAGEIDMPAIDALDLLPRLGLDIAQPQFLRQLTGDAHKLSPTQDAEQIGAIDDPVLLLTSELLRDQPLPP